MLRFVCAFAIGLAASSAAFACDEDRFISSDYIDQQAREQAIESRRTYEDAERYRHELDAEYQASQNRRALENIESDLRTANTLRMYDSR